jgi:hypothetical protein
LALRRTAGSRPLSRRLTQPERWPECRLDLSQSGVSQVQ